MQLDDKALFILRQLRDRHDRGAVEPALLSVIESEMPDDAFTPADRSADGRWTDRVGATRRALQSLEDAGLVTSSPGIAKPQRAYTEASQSSGDIMVGLTSAGKDFVFPDE